MGRAELCIGKGWKQKYRSFSKQKRKKDAEMMEISPNFSPKIHRCGWMSTSLLIHQHRARRLESFARNLNMELETTRQHLHPVMFLKLINILQVIKKY